MVAREYEEVLGKTIKLKLPFHSSFGKKEHYVEQLIWSELGDYVRQLIRKKAGDALWREWNRNRKNCMPF